MIYHLLLGGNMGDVAATFATALEKIGECGHVTRLSSVHRTAAWGMEPGTPDFLNQAVELSTELSPFSLLAFLQHVERTMGRTHKTRPGEAYADRNIDIDILLAGDTEVNTEVLTIPHPRLALRSFALEPLAEICPQARVPRTGATVAELAERLRQ